MHDVDGEVLVLVGAAAMATGSGVEPQYRTSWPISLQSVLAEISLGCRDQRSILRNVADQPIHVLSLRIHPMDSVGSPGVILWRNSPDRVYLARLLVKTPLRLRFAAAAGHTLARLADLSRDPASKTTTEDTKWG